MKILLDAGHGGHDPGAVANNGVEEEDINLEVVLELGKLLRNEGHQVLLTRDKDIYITPNDRLKMIKDYRPDCCISIHCNAAVSPEASGVETIYADGYDLTFAQLIQDAMVKHTGLRNRGLLHESLTPHKKLAVLRDLMTPACLVELGFITNRNDLVKLKQTQMLASAITEGLKAWA